jgi:hypothetical protein
MTLMRKKWALYALVLVEACANDFEPASKVDSVRVLATRADKAYAAPGEQVTLDVLAFDGRPNQSEPMRTYWVPTPCVDPPGDAYYACYPSFRDAFPIGADLTPMLANRSSFSFRMPDDAITRHGGRGQGEPYGLVVLFVVACAGHVQYVPPPSGASPEALPLGCFDSAGHALGPSDFVVAFSRVYAFASRANANPVIDHVSFGGTAVDPAAGITLSHCSASSIDACATAPLDTVVPASSQEVDPSSNDATGNPAKEEIWVDYYLTAGKVKNDTVILYALTSGQLPQTSVAFSTPQSAGEFVLWSVVHDNRGGVNWVTVPLHVN